MRRFYATILLIALLFLQHSPANAKEESEQRSRGSTSTPASEQAFARQEPAQGPDDEESATDDGVPSPLSRDEVCRMIERAANEEELPSEFFARLIWQESRFDPLAVSPVGAQGIAQFMPRTANGRGLTDPFDALPALFESAEYLGELRKQFGNLGLAAAAYNAGPKRVQDWLAKRGPMSTETRNYVRLITGRPLETWAAGRPPSFDDIAVETFRCHEVPKHAARRYRLLAEALRRAAQEEAARAAQAERKIRTARATKQRPGRSKLTIMVDTAPRGGRRAKTKAKMLASSDRVQTGVREANRQRKASATKGKAAARTRVARNTGEGDRRCSQAKGRKSCREV
jgi:hypothetical protein